MTAAWAVQGTVVAVLVGLASWWWVAHYSNVPFLPPRALVLEPPITARSVLFKEIDEFVAEVQDLAVWLDEVATLLEDLPPLP
jgi:hypothetical protein